LLQFPVSSFQSFINLNHLVVYYSYAFHYLFQSKNSLYLVGCSISSLSMYVKLL
jgi:hypothetical protein